MASHAAYVSTGAPPASRLSITGSAVTLDVYHGAVHLHHSEHTGREPAHTALRDLGFDCADLQPVVGEPGSECYRVPARPGLDAMRIEFHAR